VTIDQTVIGVGIIGLGGAAVAMIPRFAINPKFEIRGAADLDPEILSRFQEDFPNAMVTTDAEKLCSQPGINLVYIATPNHLHTTHCELAMSFGKHVLIEKPMTVDVEEGLSLVASAEKHGVLLGVNVKHSFEPRILRIREMVCTGELGQLRMINHWRYQDWLYRPRSGEELTPGPGGGILWRQGPHQFDIIRTIGGGLVRSVRGTAATWDPERRVPGAHAAYVDFENGVFATAVYSGYDHWDSRELVHGVGKDGIFPNPEKHAAARKELASSNGADWEELAARAERYGLDRSGDMFEEPGPSSAGWILGGPFVASFDHGDVRMTPEGLVVYGDKERVEIPLITYEDGRDGRINTFYDAITTDRPLPADGSWGNATLELLLAVENSGIQRKEIFLEHQTATVD
jgi:phthalate 4,5-cis-dihydrodiol dehydrogenase